MERFVSTRALLSDGRVLLVFNNTAKGRTPLNLAVGSDAEHFRIFQTLESDPGEYSYPAMIQDHAGDIHITHTWNRRRIRAAHLPLKDIPAN